MPGRPFFRPPSGCHLRFSGRRSAGLLMAVPFVFCFSLFGVFNLIGGTVLTLMACQPKFPPHTMSLLKRLLRDYEREMNLDGYLDPMRAVGVILLLTGSLLVVIGVLLGIVACRSVNIQHRNRDSCSLSGIQLTSLNGPSTSSSVLPGTSSVRPARRKRSSHFVSPILEVDSEEEEELAGPSREPGGTETVASWHEDDGSPKVTWALSVAGHGDVAEAFLGDQAESS